MPNPALALLVFALGVLLVAWLLWPRSGLVARIRRGTQASARMGMEDALKHLYKWERAHREATLESVAGALEVPRASAAGIVEDLRQAGLLEVGEALRLTDEGRSYALRIIRTHRLWERFLADRTGVEPGEWHAHAEEQEHFLSEEAVERLDVGLGRPRFDPHGDPIPTAQGEIPEPRGRPLTALSVGDEVVITHLEDEPDTLYRELVAAGLSPGMLLRIEPGDAGRVQLHADGRSFAVSAASAANVTVVPRALAEAGGPPADWDGLTLVDVAPGEEAEVVGLSPACQGSQRRRLLDLGVVPGTRIRAELAATAGDPTAYLIRGALIALRRPQQRWVRVRRPGRSEAA